MFELALVLAASPLFFNSLLAGVVVVRPSIADKRRWRLVAYAAAVLVLLPLVGAGAQLE